MLEASDLNLNINYYFYEVERRNENQVGVSFLADGFFFPDHPNGAVNIPESSVKLAKAFVRTLLRYAGFQDIDLQTIGASIKVQLDRNSMPAAFQGGERARSGWGSRLKCTANMMLKILVCASDFESSHIFEKELERWDEMEKKLRKQISQVSQGKKSQF